MGNAKLIEVTLETGERINIDRVFKIEVTENGDLLVWRIGMTDCPAIGYTAGYWCSYKLEHEPEDYNNG